MRNQSVAWQAQLTPNNTQGSTDYSQYEAFMTDVSGSFTFIDPSGSAQTIPNVQAGVWHPQTGIAWVNATNTDATKVEFGSIV